MRGRANAAQSRFKELIAAAWHVEAFARTTRLPRLASLLKGESAGPQYKTNKEILADFHALAASGVPVTITEL